MNRNQSYAACISRISRWALCLTACWIGSAAASEQLLEVITLQHRDAADLVQVLRELVDKDDAVSGTHNQLIIKTSATRLREIRKLILQLDRPLQQFLISLKIIGERETRHSRNSLAGTAELQQNSQGTRQQLRVEARGSHAGSRGNSDYSEQIRVLEGNHARFHTEQYRRSGGPAGDREQGLSVVAHMVGAQVKMAIAPIWQSDSNSGNSGTERIAAQTVVTVTPGSWTEIGGISATGDDPEHSFVTNNYSTSRAQTRMMIKVDIVNN